MAGDDTRSGPSLPGSDHDRHAPSHSRRSPRVSGSRYGGRGDSGGQRQIDHLDTRVSGSSVGHRLQSGQDLGQRGGAVLIGDLDVQDLRVGATPAGAPSEALLLPAISPDKKVPWPQPSPWGPPDTLT